MAALGEPLSDRNSGARSSIHPAGPRQACLLERRLDLGANPYRKRISYHWVDVILVPARAREGRAVSPIAGARPDVRILPETGHRRLHGRGFRPTVRSSLSHCYDLVSSDGNRKEWCRWRGSNSRPSVYKTEGREFDRSEEHTSELQSRQYLVCRLLLEKK